MDEPYECVLAALPLLCTDIREASETLDEADESGGGEARATCVRRGRARRGQRLLGAPPARARFLGSLWAGDRGRTPRGEQDQLHGRRNTGSPL